MFKHCIFGRIWVLRMLGMLDGCRDVCCIYFLDWVVLGALVFGGGDEFGDDSYEKRRN